MASPSNPLLKEEKECLWCKNRFTSYKSKHKKFCCLLCSSHFNYEAKSSKLVNTGKTRFKSGCVKSEKWKEIFKRRVGEKHQFFGKKHSMETRKKISSSKRGITVDCWNGFLRSRNYLDRRLFRETMQKKVFERDAYKCVICDNKGDLQVHHINSWSKYPDLRFDIDNCRTLCTSCHYRITFNKDIPKEIKGWGHNLLYGK